MEIVCGCMCIKIVCCINTNSMNRCSTGEKNFYNKINPGQLWHTLQLHVLNVVYLVYTWFVLDI